MTKRKNSNASVDVKRKQITSTAISNPDESLFIDKLKNLHGVLNKGLSETGTTYFKNRNKAINLEDYSVFLKKQIIKSGTTPEVGSTVMMADFLVKPMIEIKKGDKILQVDGGALKVTDVTYSKGFMHKVLQITQHFHLDQGFQSMIP